MDQIVPPLVVIGSNNPNKVRAVTSTFGLYELFRGAVFTNRSVPSEVSEQPKSLEETVRGAVNRANAAYGSRQLAHLSDHRLGVGLESGLIKVPYTRTGYMDVCACAIVGADAVPCIGLSQAFECPRVVIDTVLHDETKTLNDGFVKLGLTDNPNLGYAEGAIGLLTKGRVTREQYTRDAVMMALIQLEFSEYYALHP